MNLLVLILSVAIAVTSFAQTTQKTSAAEAQPLGGRCHCGKVKYEAAGNVVKSSYCDCEGCRRATGTLRAPFVTVKRIGFKVTEGAPAEFRASKGEKCDAHGTWHFCRDCGTQLYWQADGGDELDLFAGALEDISAFKPTE